MERMDLSGKVALITGGTQGLGREIALEAARRGAEGVAICGRGVDRGAEVAEEIEAAGARALFVQADLALADVCRRVPAEAVETFGRVDCLVNAAANTSRGTIDTTTVREWDQMMALNVRAPFILMRECLRSMRANGGGGAIVNILSVSGRGGQPKLTAYATSKGALTVLTRNVAFAVRDDRIRVNGLNVGWMETPGEHAVQRAEGAPADWLEKADAASPFGRILRPGDVAGMVVFLLAETGAMVTGSIIDFDHNIIHGAFS